MTMCAVLALLFASLPSTPVRPPAPVVVNEVSPSERRVIDVLNQYMQGRSMRPWYMESIRSDAEAKQAIRHFYGKVKSAFFHYDDYPHVRLVAHHLFAVSVLMDNGNRISTGIVDKMPQIMFYPHTVEEDVPGIAFYDPNIFAIGMAGIHWRYPIFEAVFLQELMFLANALEQKPSAFAQPGSELYVQAELEGQVFVVDFFDDQTQGEYRCVAQDIARRHIDAADWLDALSSVTLAELRSLDRPILCEDCDVWNASYIVKIHLFAIGHEWLRLRGYATRSQEVALFRFILGL